MVKKDAHPKFSVLLPTHNRADVVGFAIQSVLNQTFKDFELLVVGDGCTDETEAVVSKFSKKDKRVKWFNFPKAAGFGYINRNKALKTAKGELVAYIGHDDVWLPNHLQVHADYFEQAPQILIAYTRPLWMGDNHILIPSFFNTDIPAVRQIFNAEHNEIPAVCMVAKLEAVKRAGYWIPGTLKAGDWDLWRRIISLDPKKRMGFIPVPTSINFKSNWRGQAEYLNESLQVTLQTIEESVHLTEVFKLRTKKSDESMQKMALDQITKQGWLEKLLMELPQAIEELVYSLTLANHTLSNDKNRMIALVKRVKANEIYKFFLKLRKFISRS